MKDTLSVAHTECIDRNDLFEEAFRYHYVITDSRTSLPNLEKRIFNDVAIHSGNALRQENLIDKSGNHFGVLLGVAVCSTGRTFTAEIAATFDPKSETAIDDFEDLLVHTTGRFIALVEIQDRVFLYQDACGMLGALHNQTNNWISSNIFLAIEDHLQKSDIYFDSETHDPFIGGYFNQTADERVERINPSYRHDVKAGTNKRFWPRAHDKFEYADDEYGTAIKEIVTSARSVVDCLQQVGPVSLPLSGGFDSRTIYACASPEARANLTQVYTYVSRWINWHDFYIAQQLLKSDNLGLELFSCIQPKSFGNQDFRNFLAQVHRLASGTFMPPTREVVNGVVAKIKRDALVLRGQQAPILRGLGIWNKPTEEWTIDYATSCVLRAVKAKSLPTTVQKALITATHDAFETLPDNARCRNVDILLMEGLNGPELSGSFGSVTQAFFMSPFNSRRFIQLFASFEREDRVTDLAHMHILLEADPRVLGVPLLGEVKQVKHEETNEQLLARFAHRKSLRKTFSQKTGGFSARFSMHRYVFGREGEEIKWRHMAGLPTANEATEIDLKPNP